LNYEVYVDEMREEKTLIVYPGRRTETARRGGGEGGV